MGDVAPMSNHDAPVLVVGGRVTGMMMAGELARYGVPVRIIDKSPGIDSHSRATYLRARSLEILHGLGFADEIVANGQPLKAVSLYANGVEVATTPDLPVDSPFPWGAAYAQNKIEAILEARLDRLGVEVERSTQLLSLNQAADEVEVTIKRSDGSDETLTTPWLIGCDGAHSTTRKLIDEEFPGEMDPTPYLIADVVVDGPIKPEVAYMCLHDKGEVWFFLLDEGRRQICATLPKGSSRSEPPTLEEMQQLVDERGFTPVRLRDPRWLTLYHTHYRLTPHYRNARVFLAGDAAHVHSVVGGQGMNTGIQDAHNLAWKLSMVMRGAAPPWWLDTYEGERRSVAEDVIAWTKEANDQLTSYIDLSPEQRERLCEHMIVPECERMNVRSHEEEIDLDYRASKLCFEADSADAPGPHAGARAPDAGPLSLAGKECTLMEAISGPQFHLLLFNPAGASSVGPDALAAAKQATVDANSGWLKVFVVAANGAQLPTGVELLEDLDGALRQRYEGDVVPLYLIRPDGYVAYRSQRVEGFGEYLGRIFG